jgi:hypothetical protein
MLTFLLPYIEQDHIYQRLDKTTWDPKVPTSVATGNPSLRWYANTANWTMAQARIKLFLCPSDNPYAATNNPVVSVYFVNSGPTAVTTHWITLSNAQGVGRTNYVGVTGGCGIIGNSWDQWAGVFLNRAQNTLGQITAADGTSNTLMFGEALGGSRRANGLDTSFAWMGVGVLGVSGGIPADIGTDTSPMRKFSSLHPGGVQFCMGDGAVRTIRRDPPAAIIRPLSGIKDGVLVDSTDILN